MRLKPSVERLAGRALDLGDHAGPFPVATGFRVPHERFRQEAWKQGDQAIFVRMLGQLERGSPNTYRMMFTERNERWADWIRARLQTPGTVFVAVGAGHLAGKDSVLVKLAERGIPSARVN